MNIKTTLLAAAIALSHGTGRAEDAEKGGFESTVTAGMDFATAYVFHGMTYNSNPCLQPFVSVEGLPIIITMWGNYNLADDTTGIGTFEANTLTEMDYFFTYPVPVDFANIDITYVAMTYPEIGWPTDGETQVGISRQIGELPIEPFFRACCMVMGPIDKNLYLEGGLKGGFPIAGKLGGSYQAKVGWEDQPDGGPSGFKDLLLTLGLDYGLTEQAALTMGLNYVGQLDDEVLPDALYDTEFYGTLGAVITF